ncbi:hypothetical protein [Legionella antarctica]|uniref:hypothetical protein n=1 Tax=Legionella antarctica TaxID=2708020 RepID=UPI001565E751|nr:hypothetical protein [Legionella antarctica]
MNKIEQQIVTASVLGTKAFKTGIAPTPCYDSDLMAIIKDRFCAETPKGEACTTAILKAWLRAWHLANLYNTCILSESPGKCLPLSPD